MAKMKYAKSIVLILLPFLVFSILWSTVVQDQSMKMLTHEKLIEDTRDLASYIESIHPEPYGEYGGKIAFHRRFQQILKAIPPQGMSVTNFYELLLPFVAAVQDGHTFINLPFSREESRHRLPLGWEIVEDKLYVSRVYFESHKPILGSVLIGINDVLYSELVGRQRRLAGAENDFGNLQNLRESLASPEGMTALIPDTKGVEKIKCLLLLRSGERMEKEVEFVEELPKDPITLVSKVELPSKKERDPNFGFIDRNKKAALLRLDNLVSYREAFEAFKNTGYKPAEDWAEHFYRQFHDTEPPEEYDKVIDGIPAMTGTLQSLAEEMKKADTEMLIIDVRRNGGGHSIGCDILVYFLYGLDVYQSVSEMLSVERLSPYLFDHHKNRSLEEINEDRAFPLKLGDYLFDERLLGETSEDESEKRDREGWIDYYENWTPTFAAEVRSGQCEASCKVPNIGVLTSPRTFSGGYWVAAFLEKAGAQIVGIPSGQAGNHFGSVLQLTLANTGITLSVPTKQFLIFPDDPERGRLLRPDLELTLEKLKAYDFDPNAEVLLALETLLGIKPSFIFKFHLMAGSFCAAVPDNAVRHGSYLLTPIPSYKPGSDLLFHILFPASRDIFLFPRQGRTG